MFRATRSIVALAALGSSAVAQITFHPAVRIPLQHLHPASVAAGDFDSDGDRDLAVTTGQFPVGGTDYVEILLNDGQGGFSSGQQIALGNNLGAAAIVVANLDGDHGLDLAVSLQNSGAIRVLINHGGVFSLGALVPIGAGGPQHMAAGDLDDDGDVDLVTSNHVSDSLRVLINNGSGVFFLGPLLGTGLEPRQVVIADVNHDARRDLFVAVHDNRRLEGFLNMGNASSFSGNQYVTVLGNERPSGLLAADLDRDGDIDLATTLQHNNAGQVIVLANSGSAAFTQAAFATNGANPGAIAAADFDNDSDLDLATSDEDSNVVSVLANTGSLHFAAGATFAAGLHPSALVATDLDADGLPDIAVADRDADDVSILINTTFGGGGPPKFCIAGTSSNGCTGSISANANPCLSQGGSCQITVTNIDGQRSGIVFYGLGQMVQPWCSANGGTAFLCVKSPTQRSVAQSTGGAAGACNGSLTLDWSATQMVHPSGLGAPWNPGANAYVQAWYRDPQSCKTTQLSNALVLTYQP
jgi:hypothetical protein